MRREEEVVVVIGGEEREREREGGRCDSTFYFYFSVFLIPRGHDCLLEFFRKILLGQYLGTYIPTR